jgi:hypothetical protein
MPQIENAHAFNALLMFPSLVRVSVEKIAMRSTCAAETHVCSRAPARRARIAAFSASMIPDDR